ncbi:Piso0_005665 [Millerozyma farinosa CBS 7064]|uniref:Piso0_005665 protein n=1 Tax=Pichia sorbitophila (strain ATCC MYA-4447 / BCRC 22081 / CBS 7064 / NBRC 10061 / NRRL Y-12695) TaxID=559304 RepID=G8XZL7_PICSO|nr:Piso0_005665 [Millerozyma farinosa CBS 7064]
MSTQERKRLRLVVPNNVKGKVLKTCIRCRQHKTRCDAWDTRPYGCTHCMKKNVACTLDIITKMPNRSNDVMNRLVAEVKSMKSCVNRLVEHKAQMVEGLMANGLLKGGVASAGASNGVSKPTPSIATLERCLESPLSTPGPLTPESPRGDGAYVLDSDAGRQPVSLTHEEVLECFRVYEAHFNKFLPIFPDHFFETVSVGALYARNSVLFWSIILTAYLNSSNAARYLMLAAHMKALVVQKCWFNTPRSVYTLSALLILTTWPLPANKGETMSENLSVKYLSLMNNLALQLGLHRTEFINEFSHKTEVDVSTEISLNNLIRERIYKFISINSSYWLVYSGLSHFSLHGLQQDYIINKANQELLKKKIETKEDKYINSLLKISLIQVKSNETLNYISTNKSHTYSNQSSEKAMSMYMFEKILNNFNKPSSPLLNNNLIKISIEFSKLQLYVYAFGKSDISLSDYRVYVQKALKTCYSLVNLCSQEFGSVHNFNSLPIHYKFVIELATMVMLRIHSSPLLSSVQEYKVLKQNFQVLYGLIVKNTDGDWSILNKKTLKIVDKYNQVFRENPKLILSDSGSFFLIHKMGKYQLTSLSYDLIWSIYVSVNGRNHENIDMRSSINWSRFGLNPDMPKDREVIDYLSRDCSIFSNF